MDKIACPVCGRQVTLRSGKIFKHGGKNSCRGELVTRNSCKGSRLTPEQAVGLTVMGHSPASTNSEKVP